ncbi:MAG: Xylulose kinase [Candidatus Hydrogenedentes bacterium ADurb.Bin179]|nr:MAG: Xylulose kinase [Candidatus Hydrogenedentes bacterium ADurb.Bin179]
MYFLSIDVGTSSVKTAVFDMDGNELSTAVKTYIMENTCPGMVEVHPELYWKKTQEAIRDALSGTVIHRNINAVGITSQGETLITLDRQGLPLGNAIVWLDTRAKEEAREIEEHFGSDKIYQVTGQSEVSAGYTASMILWLKKHEPERFRLTDKFLLVTDYIVYKLTGKYISNKSLYPSTLYYDFRNERWWKEMLDFLCIDENKLPELADSGAAAGKTKSGFNNSRYYLSWCPKPKDMAKIYLLSRKICRCKSPENFFQAQG